MIEGIGIDIIENQRLKHLVKDQNFLNRIYTKNEISEGLKRKNQLEFFSSRFAIKEAFVKAIKTGFGKGINFKDIEVLKINSAPQVKVHGEKLKKLLKNKKVHISLSHEKKFSVAVVIIEKIN